MTNLVGNLQLVTCSAWLHFAIAGCIFADCKVSVGNTHDCGCTGGNQCTSSMYRVILDGGGSVTILQASLPACIRLILIAGRLPAQSSRLRCAGGSDQAPQGHL
jgi:hypothetical protein